MASWVTREKPPAGGGDVTRKRENGKTGKLENGKTGKLENEKTEGRETEEKRGRPGGGSDRLSLVASHRIRRMFATRARRESTHGHDILNLPFFLGETPHRSYDDVRPRRSMPPPNRRTSTMDPVRASIVCATWGSWGFGEGTRGCGRKPRASRGTDGWGTNRRGHISVLVSMISTSSVPVSLSIVIPVSLPIAQRRRMGIPVSLPIVQRRRMGIPVSLPIVQRRRMGIPVSLSQI